MKEIDITQWTKVGEGGNGSTFENPGQPDVILKVNKPKLNTLDIIRHEYEVSRAVESLGLQTPRMLEMVKVGSAFGTVSERIRNKKSLSRICHDESDRTEEMARVLSCEGKKLFATPCTVDSFPSRKEQLLGVIDKVAFLSRNARKQVREFAATIPENENCVHGDFQSGNIIFSQGKYYWIDLDRFAHGDPMFDIGHLFLICRYYASMKQVQNLFRMSQEQLARFWDAFAKDFTGKEDHGGFDAQAGKFALLDMIVRYNFGVPSFAENIFFSFIARRIIKEYYR